MEDLQAKIAKEKALRVISEPIIKIIQKEKPWYYSKKRFLGLQKKRISELLDKGADIEVKTEEVGETPLMIAAFQGNKELVEFLLDKRADIKAKNKHGESAFEYANYSGNKEIIKFLKSHFLPKTVLRRGSQISPRLSDDEKSNNVHPVKPKPDSKGLPAFRMQR